MCILFHIIIQCLHTGILLKLLKESVKKVRQILVYKFLPLPKIHTNKIHFKQSLPNLCFLLNLLNLSFQHEKYNRMNTQGEMLTYTSVLSCKNAI